MNVAKLTREEITAWFALGSDSTSTQAETKNKIGFELEFWVVDHESGNQLPYHGAHGMQALLLMLYRELLEEEGWKKLEDEGVLTGLGHPNHGTLTLEPGCALEYSSPALPSCTAVFADFQLVLEKIRPLINSFGATLILLGSAPFGINNPSQWLPKSRVKARGDYFQDQADGDTGHFVMSQICSLQVCIDISNEDFSDKLRASSLLAPLFAALSANSYIDQGVVSPFVSKRQLVWLNADTLRTGTPPTLFSTPHKPFLLDEYIDWLMDMPMMFYVRNGLYHQLPRNSFRSWLSNPFPDGTSPTIYDWATHLSSVFPDVRVRQYLEFRIMDAPHRSVLLPLVTLFTSLLYDPEATKYILNSLPQYDASQRAELYRAIASKGLWAKIGNDVIIDLIQPLLEEGRQALIRRISRKIESQHLLAQFDESVDRIKDATKQQRQLFSIDSKRKIGDIIPLSEVVAVNSL